MTRRERAIERVWALPAVQDELGRLALPGLTPEQKLRLMRQHFDPETVDALVRMFTDLEPPR